MELFFKNPIRRFSDSLLRNISLGSIVIYYSFMICVFVYEYIYNKTMKEEIKVKVTSLNLEMDRQIKNIDAYERAILALFIILIFEIVCFYCSHFVLKKLNKDVNVFNFIPVESSINNNDSNSNDTSNINDIRDDTANNSNSNGTSSNTSNTNNIRDSTTNTDNIRDITTNTGINNDTENTDNIRDSTTNTGIDNDTENEWPFFNNQLTKNEYMMILISFIFEIVSLNIHSIFRITPVSKITDIDPQHNSYFDLYTYFSTMILLVPLSIFKIDPYDGMLLLYLIKVAAIAQINNFNFFGKIKKHQLTNIKDWKYLSVEFINQLEKMLKKYNFTTENCFFEFNLKEGIFVQNKSMIIISTSSLKYFKERGLLGYIAYACCEFESNVERKINFAMFFAGVLIFIILFLIMQTRLSTNNFCMQTMYTVRIYRLLELFAFIFINYISRWLEMSCDKSIAKNGFGEILIEYIMKFNEYGNRRDSPVFSDAIYIISPWNSLYDRLRSIKSIKTE